MSLNLIQVPLTLSLPTAPNGAVLVSPSVSGSCGLLQSLNELSLDTELPYKWPRPCIACFSCLGPISTDFLRILFVLKVDIEQDSVS